MVVSRAMLNKLLSTEDLLVVKNATGEKSYEYHNVKLITTDTLKWMHPGANEAQKYSWNEMTLDFFFPKKNIIRTVRLKSCWAAFAKVQRINIMSWLSHHLINYNKNPFHQIYDPKKIAFPKNLRASACLVGAALTDITHEELAERYANRGVFKNGWIYPEEEYHTIAKDVETALLTRDHERSYFFPKCSGVDTLAYDCLPKTVNQALGFLFFSQREQIIRLIKSKHHLNDDRATMMKAKGGVPIDFFSDFCIAGDTSYSLKQLKDFHQKKILHVNALKAQ